MGELVLHKEAIMQDSATDPLWEAISTSDC